MRLLAIGKSSHDSPEMDVFRRYAARIKPTLDLTELPYGFGAPPEIKRREADALLGLIKDSDFVIALDGGGQTPDSPELAKLFRKWLETGRKLTFIIGGAEGLDARMVARANATLSLGKLTWPHMLVRPMLAEQIFRAQAINANHPYHRAGRP